MSFVTLAFKGKTLKVVTLEEGTMTIGSDPACDIHIDSLAVQPLHARIVTSGGGCVISDARGEATLLVKGAKTTEHTLSDGDDVLIGKHTLRFTATDAAPSQTETVGGESPSPRMSAWLQFLSGDAMGKTMRLKSALTNLANLGMPPVLIARRAGGYYVSNLGDAGAVTVGGQSLGEESHQLQDGDILRIGDVELQFLLQSEQ